MIYWLIFLFSIEKIAPVKLISSTPTSCVLEFPEGKEEMFAFIGIPPMAKIRCSGGEIDRIMWVRRHRIARICVSPNIRGTKRVQVIWEHPRINLGVPEKTDFELILKRHLLNYETSKYWVRPRKRELEFLKSDAPRYKILVNGEGICRIKYDKVTSVVPQIANADPKTIKITHCDLELPIVVKGEEDGKFDQNDWIEFYAERKRGKFSYLHLYSDTNVYWLSFGGKYGARLVKESAFPGDAEIPSSYMCKLHFEQDSIYRLFKSYPDTFDGWLWKEFSTECAFYFETPNLLDVGECSLKINVRTVGGPGNCEIKINNNVIGVVDFPGGSGRVKTFELSFSQDILEHSNTLVLTPSKGTIYLNFIELIYNKLYIPYNGRIKFYAPSPQVYRFKIGGFTKPNIRVWKVGTSVIEGRRVYEDASGTYTYSFETTSEESTFYVAQDYILEPLDIRTIESDLKSSLNRANYVIITNSLLYDCALRYMEWVESKGFICKVVKVQEIYDEFNFGIEDAKVIRDFLAYAFEVWQVPPVYVLLLGDASYDHRNILGFGEDIVPTIGIHDENLVIIPSDNLYACVSGDDPIPDLFISRLPVRSVNEFNLVFEKIRNYKLNRVFGDWRKTLVFGIHREGGIVEIAEGVIKKYVPSEFEVKKIYYPPLTQPNIVDAINKGAVIISYIGHSAPSNWAGGLLWREAIPGLMNVGRLSFIQVLGCYNGVFDRPEPERESMGELFIRSPGGAISYWGPTGGLYGSDKGLLEGPLEVFFSDTISAVGVLSVEGIIKCFEERRQPKTVLQQVLFGDASTLIYTPQPGIKLTITPSSIYPGGSATITGSCPLPIDGEIILTFYASDTIQFKKIKTIVNNGVFEVSVTIPDTIEAGNGKIMSYAYSDTLDFVGTTKFSIVKSNIHPIYIIPKNLTFRDSVLIRAKVFDAVGVKWVRCMWGTKPPPWNLIDMELDTGGYFITKSFIPPHPPRTEILFKIETQNWDNEIFSACSSYKVSSLPDLKVYSRPKLDGTSHVYICGGIINNGEESTDSFEVHFYAIDSLTDTLFLGKDTISLKGKEYKSISFPWDLKQSKVLIVIDPQDIVYESNEGNNRQIYDVPVTLFNVTPSMGTQGWVSSIDKKFSCLIKENSVNIPTVLEMKDTTLGYLVRFRQREVSLSRPMQIAFLPEPGLSIYRWSSEYNKWLFITSDTLGSTQKLGIFSLLVREDTIAPQIKLSISVPETTIYIDGKSISLKIEAIFTDESGIDIVDRKISVLNNGDVVPESLYSYPTEEVSLYALPFVLRKSFGLGDYVLSFIVYDFHGNKSEKSINLHIKPKFKPEEEYWWGNYPNPVRGEGTKFYFEFTDVPDEFYVELYTVSGRLLRTFKKIPTNKRVEFYWDTRVEGKFCANGVYFYKVFARKGDEKITKILKLAILR